MFGFLFRLAAKAHGLPQKEVLRRLLVGLSNRFDAVTCSYYALDGSVPSRSTEPADVVAPIAGEIRTLAAAIANRCRSEGKVVSALDLSEGHAEDRRRIEAVLGPCDTFGFPLMAEGVMRGCIVICLRGEEVLGDADLHALLSIGECLHAAFANARDDASMVDAA